MRRIIAFILLSCLILAAVCVSYFANSSSQNNLEDELGKALSAYRQGESGTTIAARKQGFNSALDIYTQLEQKYKPCFSTGKFYYNLANTYFQLGEYPTALLYYYRAQALQPRNDDIQHNLNVALEKLNLPKQEPSSDVQKIFFFHHYLSMPERLQILAYLGIGLLAVISLRIAYPKFFFKYIITVLGIIYFLFSASLLYSRYVEPLQGILVKSSYLYRDKGKEYAKVYKTASAAGLKVEILDIQSQGTWYKILTPDGVLGYVPQESIRVISCN